MLPGYTGDKTTGICIGSSPLASNPSPLGDDTPTVSPDAALATTMSTPTVPPRTHSSSPTPHQSHDDDLMPLPNPLPSRDDEDDEVYEEPFDDKAHKQLGNLSEFLANLILS
ncbi:hypothetical protein QCA50_018904 [Cerrena zonata]|uniref:Uncharacterized protein n=1 Tax=Cerrena zonata TaxID=2478898 RepID=A0AAW0FCI6_9APHY